MELQNGQNNPIARASKFIKFYKNYKMEQVEEGEGSVYNPNVINSQNPLETNDLDTQDNSPVRLGREFDDPNYGLIKKDTQFQSGMMIIDPELKLLKAISNERNLLSKAGLDINPTDDVRVIKDNNGNLKAAISFGSKHMGQIKRIRYIDVDPDSMNFSKAVVKMFGDENSSICFHENDEVDVKRCSINNRVLSE